MRWILITLLLSTLAYWATRHAVVFTDNNARAFWEWVPGTQSSALQDLDPQFRVDVTNILSQLDREGYKARIITTWRSPLRQSLIYHYSQVRAWAGLGPASLVAASASCHIRADQRGRPRALAVDIALDEQAPLTRHAEFFHRLGTLAIARKLDWGGLWQRSNATWRKFGLGWDPGHLESLQCRLSH